MRRFSSTRAVVSLFLIPAVVILSGCGGDDDSIFDSGSGFTQARVTDVRVDPEAVVLNQEIGIQVDFTPADFDSSLEATTVALKLPPGVQYVTGSSDFDGSDVGGFRSRGPNRVESCIDGTTALTYDFSSGEMTDNENKIRLSAVAVAGRGNVFFIAEAAANLGDSCAILGEDADNIVIQ